MTRLLLTVLFFLSSAPAYAEWMMIDEGISGSTIYVNPDTIRRKGQRVNMWVLYDFKTIQTRAVNSYLSLKIQEEYDCTKERSRSLAGKIFSGSMGTGNVVLADSYKSEWEPVTPGSIAQGLLKVACGKGQSPGRTPASPPINTSFEDDLQTLQAQAAQGDAKAQYFLGVLYAKGLEVPQDYGEALKWFRLSAAQGNADAQSTLGAMYNHGTGVPQDSREALKWFRLSAAQGSADAQYNLGVNYANGYGVPQNSAEALKWFRLSAAQGDAGGQYNLGLLYARGEGVQQDFREAIKWLRLSAAQAHMGAQYNLGVMYAMGQGVPQDDVRAYMWWSLSAAHSTGDEQKLAAGNRDEVARSMTPAQLAEAQRLSQQCQARQFKGC